MKCLITKLGEAVANENLLKFTDTFVVYEYDVVSNTTLQKRLDETLFFDETISYVQFMVEDSGNCLTNYGLFNSANGFKPIGTYDYYDFVPNKTYTVKRTNIAVTNYINLYAQPQMVINSGKIKLKIWVAHK